MPQRPVWSTWAAASVVLAGLLAAAIGVVVVFVGSLCQLGANCGTSDHLTALAGLVLIAFGLGGPPVLAAWATRRWWWVAVPALVVATVVVAVRIDNARDGARDRRAVISRDAALAVARTVDDVAGFGPTPLPPPTATLAARVQLARETEQAEMTVLEGARRRLAAHGIILGAEHGSDRVDLAQDGQRYCYHVPVFALRGVALPGDCP